MFHCWSCNFSGGITKFMKSIGETVHIDVDSKQPYKIKKLKEKLQALLPDLNVQTREDKNALVYKTNEIPISGLTKQRVRTL